MEKILKHLYESRQKLLDSAAGLTQEKMDRPHRNGGWSVGEVLQHLYLTEKAVLSMFRRLLTGDLKSKKSVWDRIRKLPPRWIAYRGVRIKTFKKLKPIGSKLKAEIFDDLARSRQDLIRFIQTPEKEHWEGLTYPHFILGELNFYEWLYFIGYHEDRHRKQIKEIKKDSEVLTILKT